MYRFHTTSIILPAGWLALDMYVSSDQVPLPDAAQHVNVTTGTQGSFDYTLLLPGSYVDGQGNVVGSVKSGIQYETLASFSRPLNSCDNQDIAINQGVPYQVGC